MEVCLDKLDGAVAFVRAVEAGSFALAGQRLGLTGSAVSKRVAALEARLGLTLLHRTTRSLSLTPDGQAFYERSARVLADLEDAELAMAHLHASPRGRLRLDLPVAFGRMHVLPALPEFLARFPELTVDATLNDRFIDPVEEGVDLLIRIGELKDSSLIAKRLAPSRAVLCAAPAYLERRGEPSTVADLAAHNCLAFTYAGQPHDWRFLDESGREVRVDVSGNLRLNNGEGLREAALAGLGIVLLHTHIVGEDLKAGRLRAIGLAGHRLKTDAAGLAVAALRHLFLDPGCLDGMRAVGREPLDSRDGGALGGAGRGDAGARDLPVKAYRAGAAQAGAAAEFRAGQSEMVAQHP